MRYYISGPMSGIPQFNAPAFKAVAKQLRERGFEVLSPVELDEKDGISEAVLSSLDGDVRKIKETTCISYGQMLGRDVQMLFDERLDGIVVLEGWQKSRGARIEVFVGLLRGLPIFEIQGIGLRHVRPDVVLVHITNSIVPGGFQYVC